MSTRSADISRQKLTINLPERSAQRLRRLAESREETLNDCVEAALNVFDYLIQARLDGFTLLLHHPTSDTTRELVLLDLPDPLPDQQAPNPPAAPAEASVEDLVDGIVDRLVQRLNTPGADDKLRRALGNTVTTGT